METIILTFIASVLLLPCYISFRFEVKRKRYESKYKFYKKMGLDPKHIYKGGYAFPIGFKTKDGRIISSGYYD